jgi:uncharacterized protein YndB with AHSA1/START domain
MARLEETIVIKCPVNKVFAYVTDVQKMRTWHSAMLEVEQTSPGQMSVGTTFRGVTRALGRRMDWVCEVKEYETNKKFTSTIKSGSSSIGEYVTFNTVEGGTKFTAVWETKAVGWLRLFSPSLNSALRKQMRRSIIDLKSILEAQT